MANESPVPPFTVAPLRCGGCGGSFQEGDAACPWCGAGIALEDRGRSHVCARCAVRAPVGAAWCHGCGERLGEQPVAPRSDAAACPACRALLRERRVGAHQLTECGGCGGLWLAASVLDELCGAAERAGIARVFASPPRAAPAPSAAERVVYRGCPACREPMSRRNFGGSSGIVVDACKPHGVWLDSHELERVLAWVRAGGPERERQRRVERARRTEARSEPRSPMMLPDGGGERSSRRLEFGLMEAISWVLGQLR